VVATFRPYGGLSGIANCFNAYFHRNDGKTISVKGEKVDASGYSMKDFEKILEVVRKTK